MALQRSRRTICIWILCRLALQSALSSFLVAKVGEPNRDDVAGFQNFFGNSLFVDVDTVPASPVDDVGRIVIGGNHGVSPAYESKVELNVVVPGASN